MCGAREEWGETRYLCNVGLRGARQYQRGPLAHVGRSLATIRPKT
jgi:hypothetical protein